MQVELNRVETKKPTNQSDVGFSVSYDCISGAEENPNSHPKQSTEIQITASNPNKTGYFAVAFVFYRPILSIYIR